MTGLDSHLELHHGNIGCDPGTRPNKGLCSAGSSDHTTDPLTSPQASMELKQWPVEHVLDVSLVSPGTSPPKESCMAGMEPSGKQVASVCDLVLFDVLFTPAFQTRENPEGFISAEKIRLK